MHADYKLTFFFFSNDMHYFVSYRIPNVTVSRDGNDVELEISDDPHDCRQFLVDTIPIIVTLTKVTKSVGSQNITTHSSRQGQRVEE